MQKKLLYTVLCSCLTVITLTGCAGTNKESTPIENTSEIINSSVETVVEDTKEEPTPNSSEEKITAEVSGGSTEDVAEVKETDETADTEEAEPEISVEDNEFNANLSEYLKSIDVETYGWEKNGRYKVGFYADDINGDGFPEIFQYRYRDITADYREFDLIRHNMLKRWDDEQHRFVFFSVGDMFRVEESHLMSAAFGSPEIDMSYTRGEENILYTGAVTFGNNGTEITYKEIKVFRDAEMLYGGSTRMKKSYISGDQWLVTYFTHDASNKNYEDEEHFNNFDSDSTYETTIRFGTDELWSTWQEAVEHIGELP